MILKQKFTTFIFLKIFFLFFSSLIINAQTTYHDFGFQKKFDIVVYDTSNNILQRAWEGGLNSVQFGNIDLNLDGIEDLVIFDNFLKFMIGLFLKIIIMMVKPIFLHTLMEELQFIKTLQLYPVDFHLN